ncbi:Mrx12p CYBJADRAFT_167446 [Cyberlindnera jadinii NRRL Y-1542]|uniref:Uncharacterized protein n=1 Tax=Cyberlindnera jadinii (strain ATCC 18201 / CBS 1600 / BCRC 20928 / JCM 3617 / NBRC 0987 / NRRL Y-1542) TaxID=983966 RepID=A0A1E4S3I7_CYBJN|nr:hypothetical protein CYBJADRAFT_167446 [Cyberlindnera jadinii NRRL Y-1542]ODV74061.1 hypothetical protein CYBJADRAFT_167446 [Cyberlindnera jadinii NRRL Y-1542]
MLVSRCSYAIRLYSTKVLNLPKAGSLEGYKSYIQQPHLQSNPQLVSKLFEQVYRDTHLSDEDKGQLHNEVLSKLLPFDASLTTHARSLEKLGQQMSPEALEQVIVNNKGRVDSSWDIFEKWLLNNPRVSNSDIQGALQQVLAKVVHGDPSEHEDGYSMNEEALVRAVWILKNLERQMDKEIVELIIKKTMEVGDWSLIHELGINSLADIEALDPSDEQLLTLWLSLQSTELSEHEVKAHLKLIERILTILSKKTSEAPTINTEMFSKLNKRFPNLAVEQRIMEQKSVDNLIEQLTTILNTETTGLTQLRTTMLKCVGMYLGQFSKSLELYHHYIVIDGPYVDEYMTTMVQVASYQGVKNNSQVFLAIADSLTPQPVPLKCLRVKILAKALFNVDDSLDIYNEYIQQCSKENNDSGVSQAGLLTESLLLAYLCNEQREFAYVIREGAIANGLIQGVTAQNRLKRYLKTYGDIIEQEGDHGELFKREILSELEEL